MSENEKRNRMHNKMELIFFCLVINLFFLGCGDGPEANGDSALIDEAAGTVQHESAIQDEDDSFAISSYQIDKVGAVEVGYSDTTVVWKNSKMGAKKYDPKKPSFRYKLTKPQTKAKLNKQLREISGIAYDEANARLLAVNDEVGKIYILDPAKGDIISQQKFGFPGDYEDLTLVGELLYVIKSDGLINVLSSVTLTSIQKMKSGLSISNDVEGICYDSESKRLLLACKGNPDSRTADAPKGSRSIYAFDPLTQTLDQNPFLLITKDALEDFVKTHANKKTKKKRLKKFVKRAKEIAPSAIGIHPISGKIYVLSSVGKLLVVFNRDQQIEHIEFLNSKIHKQPEGLTFASNGDLFISNEGPSGKGVVYRFRENRD